MSFAHLIITRFNLRYPNSEPVSEAWLAHRLPLFRDFCYASVRGQTCQNFRWLVLFDTTTPPAFRAQIDELATWDNFVPCYIDGFDYEAILALIRPYITADTTHLLTTTLDNDDALAADFVAEVQAQVAGQAFELLNFRHGYRLNTATDKLYDVAIATNPFVSLIENVEQGQFLSIVGCLPHSTMAQRFSSAIREIETRPLWLQVVHGRNLAPTGIVGRQRTTIDHLGRFVLAGRPSVSESAASIRLDQIKGTAERALLNLVPERLKTKIRNR